MREDALQALLTRINAKEKTTFLDLSKSFTSGAGFQPLCGAKRLRRIDLRVLRRIYNEENGRGETIALNISPILRSMIPYELETIQYHESSDSDELPSSMEDVIDELRNARAARLKQQGAKCYDCWSDLSPDELSPITVESSLRVRHMRKQ